jgi:hypothetical protein
MVNTTLVFGTVTLLLVSACPTQAQENETRQIVVQAEADELPSAYGAPPDLSHGRISTLTKSYVLSPFSFEVEAGYEGSIFYHESPFHVFRQEIEMGLPARFTIGVQNQFERVAGRHARTQLHVGSALCARQLEQTTVESGNLSRVSLRPQPCVARFR